jgi:RNA polymerase sigma-70 factor (ECF subfamily)
MLRRLAGDDADDLAQDTFLIAWRGAASWRQEGSYRAWLLRIAWRQFLSHQRRDKPTEPIEAAEALGVHTCADEKAAIAQAMGRLGERERMAAHLCFAEGFTHEEAAMIMHVPLGTLKSLVARAKRELAAHLENGQ